MMHKSRLDFFAQLLEAAKHGTTDDQTASQTGTPQKLVDESLCLLVDLSLLTRAHHSPVSFATTQRRLQFLQDYQRLKQRFSGETCVDGRP